jgi:HTH-type transcriptional regulator / antitoxin HigA
MCCIQPIRNLQDHQAALQEIEHLFDCEQESPEFDRLEILTILVQAYEDKHEPILPPEPFAERLR